MDLMILSVGIRIFLKFLAWNKDMTFANEKKTFLAKSDKSKKGSIDIRMLPIIKVVNSHSGYYTTSSCSGRVYFWQGSEKKNEMEWVKVSHELIDVSFLEIPARRGVVWLRFESSIIHIACDSLQSANGLLDAVKSLYKKSSILTARKKIIVEIRGGEILEMPFYRDGELQFSGDRKWLLDLINHKLEKNLERLEKLKSVIERVK